jgi:acetyl esterase/lipase
MVAEPAAHQVGRRRPEPHRRAGSSLRLVTELAEVVRRPDGQAVSVDADVSTTVFRPMSSQSGYRRCCASTAVECCRRSRQRRRRTSRRTGAAGEGSRRVPSSAANALVTDAGRPDPARTDVARATADGEVSPVAAPARCVGLSGLPPAWIGVGTNHLFHDEDVTRPTTTAGRVARALNSVPVAYHAFDSAEAKTVV